MQLLLLIINISNVSVMQLPRYRVKVIGLLNSVIRFRIFMASELVHVQSIIIPKWVNNFGLPCFICNLQLYLILV